MIESLHGLHRTHCAEGLWISQSKQRTLRGRNKLASHHKQAHWNLQLGGPSPSFLHPVYVVANSTKRKSDNKKSAPDCWVALATTGSSAPAPLYDERNIRALPCCRANRHRARWVRKNRVKICYESSKKIMSAINYQG
jgi:hypothetical protein